MGLPLSTSAQQDPADRLPPELHKRLVPRVTPLPGEHLVARSAFIDATPVGKGYGSHLFNIWQAGGGVVLDAGRPGLTLHFYAEGIEAMTLTDKLWEGLPTRAESMQHLMDETIGQSRKARQPIAHLIITGHAGLPGCSAWGGTMDDCTFRGRLTTYQRQQLTRLRPYLASDAEIELRQCGTGSGKAGQRLLTAVYEITGAATSSYLADFHFGDAANHPRVRAGADGFEILRAGE
ncbi:MAG: hypothetical protein AB8C95_12080 [Phycisphaeraceae bacterium]